MKTKPIALSILLLLSIQILVAQSYYSIKGKVIDYSDLTEILFYLIAFKTLFF